MRERGRERGRVVSGNEGEKQHLSHEEKKRPSAYSVHFILYCCHVNSLG